MFDIATQELLLTGEARYADAPACWNALFRAVANQGARCSAARKLASARQRPQPELIGPDTRRAAMGEAVSD